MKLTKKPFCGKDYTIKKVRWKMSSTAKKIHSETDPAFEKWLTEEVDPMAADFWSGKRKGSPLSEAYERGLKVLAEEELARDEK